MTEQNQNFFIEYLTYNTFYNHIHTTKSISCSLKSTVSDRSPQFIILPGFTFVKYRQCNIYTDEWEKFDEEIQELNSKEWDKMLDLDKENVTETISSYLQNMNNILEKHAPLKT